MHQNTGMTLAAHSRPTENASRHHQLFEVLIADLFITAAPFAA